MRILVINTDYVPFLQSLYGGDPTLRNATYEEQLRRRADTLFGCGDFYSQSFIGFGHEAWEVHANNGPMQAAWYTSLDPEWRPDEPLDRPVPPRPPHPSPLRSPVEPRNIDLEAILVAQARALRPDVVLNQSISEVESRVLHQIRPYTKLIVGDIASPLPVDEPYTAYDLIVSSFPHFIRYYRSHGIPAEFNMLAFEPTILDRVSACQRDVDVSFVGSLTPDHGQRIVLLERLGAETDIQIWGRLVSIPEHSPIMRNYRGEAWGRDMYHALARSKITINQHIDTAENYANNMRLFEATGMGAMLITDWKDNMADLFVPGKEVVCYHDADECIELIEYYTTHDEERAAIAAAGQRRTLKDYTYDATVADLVRLFVKGLAERE